jgi:cell division protein FtsL
MSNKRKGNKYPSPEVYDHVRFSKIKKISLKDKKIWYLAIAVAVLMVTLLAIITR